ncbi:MAG: ANTAR domain-containing response regulator [Bacillota bacterium]
MYGLRVIIADNDQASRKYLKEILHKTGCVVIGDFADGRQAAQAILRMDPDFVILNDQLPGRNGIEVARVVEEHHIAPVILMTASRGWDVIEAAKTSGAFACLIKPVSDMMLLPAMEIALGRFQREKELIQENRQLKKEIESRKTVEQAKGLLMERKGLSERDAYRYMQKVSMDKCLSLDLVARSILRSNRE